MKVIVKISPSFAYLAELKYAIELIFDEILGFDVGYIDDTNIGSATELLIDDVVLRFKHDFFSKGIYSLDEGNFTPILKEYAIISLFKSVHFPQLQGTLIDLHSSSHSNDNIYFSLENNVFETNFDFFGSAFFLATRFEEFTNNTRDKHNRFPFSASVLYPKYILRPIINEYGWFFAELLNFLKPGMLLNNNKYSISPTHDVDFPYFYTNSGFVKNIKDVYASYLDNKFKGVGEYITNRTKNALGYIKDPYDFHSEILAMNTAAGHTSTFNFMAGIEVGGFNGYYNVGEKRIQKLIHSVIRSGHNIGFHPGYNTLNNYKLFESEINLLRNITSQIDSQYTITEGRQHYLRFDVRSTLDYWNAAGMRVDSTLGFAEHPGFRTGLCTVHSVFSLSQRKKLPLLEKPLILMDVTLTSPNYLNIDLDDSHAIVEGIKNTVRKYNGVFTILFHNDWFYTNSDRRIEYYKSVLR